MIKKNQILTAYNSLAVASKSKCFITLANMDEVELFFECYQDTLKKDTFYILGDGTNTLFIEPEINMIIKPELKGSVITEDDDDYYLQVAAGENWHQLVKACIDRGINGLENLALIPGSVGAAPVQNIGAYGVEFSNFCQYVEWFDFSTGKTALLTKEQCSFGYRDSIFKQSLKNKGLITKVHLRVSKQWQPVLNYQGLSSLTAPISAQDVMLKVIAIRNEKLPDPQYIPNAGSFFKNPVVSEKHFIALSDVYPDMPHYLQVNGDVKLAAGWLIEQANLKGFKYHNVGVHDRQALVLVNNAQGSGQDMVALAKLVRSAVHDKFGIWLEPEVRFVGSHGEVDALECLNDE